MERKGSSGTLAGQAIPEGPPVCNSNRGHDGIHSSEPFQKFPRFPIVLIVLRNELHAIKIAVAVANKAPESHRLVGIRRRELNSDLRAHRQVDVGSNG